MRIIIRRPHAYFFIQDAFESEGGITSATPAGCKLGDGSTAPLPGVYLLDGEGVVLERVALVEGDARDTLLGALESASKR